MDYKKEIQELIGLVHDEKFLRRIYIIINDYIEEESEISIYRKIS